MPFALQEFTMRKFGPQLAAAESSDLICVPDASKGTLDVDSVTPNHHA